MVNRRRWGLFGPERWGTSLCRKPRWLCTFKKLEDVRGKDLFSPQSLETWKCWVCTVLAFKMLNVSQRFQHRNRWFGRGSSKDPNIFFHQNIEWNPLEKDLEERTLHYLSLICGDFVPRVFRRQAATLGWPSPSEALAIEPSPSSPRRLQPSSPSPRTRFQERGNTYWARSTTISEPSTRNTKEMAIFWCGTVLQFFVGVYFRVWEGCDGFLQVLDVWTTVKCQKSWSQVTRWEESLFQDFAPQFIFRQESLFCKWS